MVQEETSPKDNSRTEKEEGNNSMATEPGLRGRLYVFYIYSTCSGHMHLMLYPPVYSLEPDRHVTPQDITRMASFLLDDWSATTRLPKQRTYAPGL